MALDVVFKGARVVDALHHLDQVVDIGVEDGKIARLEQNLPAGKNTIHLCGKTVIPGIIDMHTHVTEQLGGHVGYHMVAKTGVTSIIDLGGPVKDVTEHQALACGLNVGCLNAINPDEVGDNPSEEVLRAFVEESLEDGALGLKMLGGHFPLTPESTASGIEVANKLRVIVAFHVGTTQSRSDIEGMREAVAMARNKHMIMPHINAYCRGKCYDHLEELRDAFAMLRENRNIIADSHMAVINGTFGMCRDGVPHDAVTANCLIMFGRPATEKGLGEAICDGLVRVIAPTGSENVLLEREEAYRYWQDMGTDASVSFPVNLAAVAVACLVERVSLGGDFLIPLAATDGGGYPRNDLPGKLLAFHRLQYISLDDVIRKGSLNPARVFGLTGKGHLGIGADADITVLDEGLTRAVASYSGGRAILDAESGDVVGTGGCLLTSQRGVKKASARGLRYALADLENSSFYKGL